MQIIDKRVEDLIPYENNPRINDGAVDAVAASISRFGWKVPLVIDKNNVVVTGHTRLKAAKALGLDTVPCILADDLSEEQVRAFRLVDNKTGELAGWDFSKLQLYFNEDPIMFREVRSEKGVELQGGSIKELLAKRKKGDKKLQHIHAREDGRNCGFTSPIVSDDEVAKTLTAGGIIVRFCDAKRLSKQDIINIQSFPQDYDFLNMPPQYVCGMSVPPVMMANIAREVLEQWL